MNISQIYEKEKEYKFFKLISEVNVNGIIEKTFKEYKIKAYIDYQSYSSNNRKIQDINTRENLVGIIRIPTIAIDTNGLTETIEISDGDYAVFNNAKFEIIEVRKLQDELKHYYTFYLTDLVQNIKFDVYKTELNTLFYKIFDSLGIGAVVYHSLFQNSYFEKKNKSFLTYEITQIKEMSDYTTTKEEISEIDKIIFRYRSNRRYKMIIRLYDKDQVLNLDTVLSKNRILNHIIDNINYRMQNVAELEVKQLELISEKDTVINNKIMNERIYSVEFTVDTFYSYETDFINGVKVTGIIKNKED